MSELTDRLRDLAERIDQVDQTYSTDATACERAADRIDHLETQVANDEVLCAAADARAERWEHLADELAERLTAHEFCGMPGSDVRTKGQAALAAYRTEKEKGQ
jgi:chromosome segregation ATPase